MCEELDLGASCLTPSTFRHSPMKRYGRVRELANRVLIQDMRITELVAQLCIGASALMHWRAGAPRAETKSRLAWLQQTSLASDRDLAESKVV